MEKRYRYQLAKKGKITCPSCGEKTFVQYADVVTKQPLPTPFGKCDRAKCWYHKNPYTAGYHRQQGVSFEVDPALAKYIPEPEPMAFLIELIKPVLNESEYVNNSLHQYLIRLYEPEKVKKVFRDYRVGSSRMYGGAVAFPLFDGQNYFGGKIIAYDINTPTCKTRKWEKGNDSGKCVSWIHKAVAKRINSLPEHFREDAFFASLTQNLDNSALHQWLFDYEVNAEKYPFPFGLHLALIASKDSPVYVVESEKTAIVCTLEIPDYVWIATGSMYNLTEKRLEKLKDRQLFLVPDGGKGFEYWCKRGQELIAKGFNIKIASIASELQENQDIADLFLAERWNAKYKPEPVRKTSKIVSSQTPIPQPENPEYQAKQENLSIEIQRQRLAFVDKHASLIESASELLGFELKDVRFNEIEPLSVQAINARQEKDKSRYYLPVKQAYQLPNGEIQLFY